jgi:ERAP1-like C-terminal domain
VPVVDLARDGGGYKATQSRYATIGRHTNDTQWIIPFCVRRGATRSCTLLDHKSQAIAANGQGPIVPNAGGTGYYRYNLSTADWDALLGIAPTLPAGEGLAASDSIWAQFSTNKVAAPQLIKAAKAFVNHPDSNVAVHSGWRLSGWRHAGWVQKDSIAGYRKLMDSIYRPRLARLGFDPRVGAHAKDSPDDQKLRQDLVELVAGEAHDAATRKSLSAAAGAYLQGKTDALDQTFYDIAMEVHVQDGTLATTQALYEKLVGAEDELFRNAALEAVGATRRTPDAQWLIGRFKDTRLRSTDKLKFMGTLMAEEETREIAFEWLKANYDDFAKGMGIFSVTIIPSFPQHYCSLEKAQEVDRLLRPRVQKAGRGELPFNRMLEGIQTCGALKTAKTAEIAAALR